MDKRINRKESEYFIKQILGLKAIVKDNSDIDKGMIGREYVVEKLNMILSGIGINLHPILKEEVNKYMIEVFGKISIEEIDYEGL